MSKNIMEEIKLTQFSHGAGCGCKISPAVLDDILKRSEKQNFPGLIVGNEHKDDAAVFDLGDGTALISTTDFFMPIVDDPADFGRIAAVNAISDVYAMGGTPLMAIAILGWPIDKLSSSVANRVIEGGRMACREAGIPLAGGHSIDSPEPIFGLAVSGKVSVKNIKKNGGASQGSKLFLTKPLGVGILSTAEKKGKLKAEHQKLARNSMIQLNRIGERFGELSYVDAMTDVTGFGLAGHLIEMCEASGTHAELDFKSIPLLDDKALDYYINEKCLPGGTFRNWESCKAKIANLTEKQIAILCDPQTSGGLLVAIKSGHETDFLNLTRAAGLDLRPIGQMKKQTSEKLITLSQVI